MEFVLCFIQGNEGRGIDEKLLSLCNQLVTIPPSPDLSDDSLDSLNVSVATGKLRFIKKKDLLLFLPPFKL